jgi:hypothetical protein
LAWPKFRIAVAAMPYSNRLHLAKTMINGTGIVIIDTANVFHLVILRKAPLACLLPRVIFLANRTIFRARRFAFDMRYTLAGFFGIVFFTSGAGAGVSGFCQKASFFKKFFIK